MSEELQSRILGALSDRSRREIEAQEDWEDSIKPSTVTGNGQIKQLGSNPLASNRILTNTTRGTGAIATVQTAGGLVGDWVPRFEEPAEAQKERQIEKGMFIWFDSNWNFGSLLANASNTAFAYDVYRTKTMYILRGDSRIYDAEGLTVPEGNFSLVEVSSIPTPRKGAVYFHPLFKFEETLTTEEFDKLKAFSKKGKVLLEMEWTPWAVYNSNMINGLGLSSYLINFEGSAIYSVSLNLSSSNKDLGRILKNKSDYSSIEVNAAGLYDLGNPDSNPNAPIGIFESGGKYAFFYVPSTFF